MPHSEECIAINLYSVGGDSRTIGSSGSRITMKNVATGPSNSESKNQFRPLRPLPWAKPALINAKVPHPTKKSLPLFIMFCILPFLAYTSATSQQIRWPKKNDDQGAKRKPGARFDHFQPKRGLFFIVMGSQKFIETTLCSTGPFGDSGELGCSKPSYHAYTDNGVCVVVT